MDKIGFWESLTISFQPRAYKRIVSQPFGRSFQYLAIFLLLLSAVLSIKYIPLLREEMEGAKEWINASGGAIIAEILPAEVKIENGQVSTLAEEPFIRQWEVGEEGRKEEITFIIDTTGRITNLDDYRTGFLLTGNKLIFKNTKPGGVARTKEDDLSQIKLFILRRGDAERGEIAFLTFNQKTIPVTYESIERWQKTTSRLLPLMIIPLFTYYLIAKMVHLFFFSLVTPIINDRTKAGLEYRNLLNIGIFALIPPIVLALLVNLAGEPIPYFHLLYILIYLIFLVMGIKGSKIVAEEEAPGRKM